MFSRKLIWVGRFDCSTGKKRRYPIMNKLPDSARRIRFDI
jgi:hypothetical protein